MKYPAECPVFRVKYSPFKTAGVNAGSIVQATDFSSIPSIPGSTLIACYAFGSFNPAAINNGGGGGWSFAPDELIPLTRAARDMLAIARGSR